MVQDAGGDDEIETPAQIADLFDRQLMKVEIRERVLALQIIGVREARGADVDARHARAWTARRVLGRLKRAATGDEDLEILPERHRRPEQMEVDAALLFVPERALAIERADRRRVRPPVIELANHVDAARRV